MDLTVTKLLLLIAFTLAITFACQTSGAPNYAQAGREILRTVALEIFVWGLLGGIVGAVNGKCRGKSQSLAWVWPPRGPPDNNTTLRLNTVLFALRQKDTLGMLILYCIQYLFLTPYMTWTPFMYLGLLFCAISSYNLFFGCFAIACRKSAA